MLKKGTARIVRIAAALLGILLIAVIVSVLTVSVKYYLLTRNPQAAVVDGNGIFLPDSMPQLGEKRTYQIMIKAPWNADPGTVDVTVPPGLQMVTDPGYTLDRYGWGVTYWRLNVELQPFRTGDLKGGKVGFSFMIPGREAQLFDLKPKYLVLRKKYAMTVIRLGLPSGLTQAIFSVAMISVQKLTNSFGEMFVAVNIMIMRVDGFAMLPNFSFGTAMTTYTGQNIGAGNMERVTKGAKQGTILAVATSATLTALILIFGKFLMGMFTETAELVDLSRKMMSIIALGYIAMAVTQSLSGIMRGAGDTVTPMWISVLTSVVIRLPIAYGLVWLTKSAEHPNGRQECIFISLLCAWLIGAIITTILYLRGGWKKKVRM